VKGKKQTRRSLSHEKRGKKPFRDSETAESATRENFKQTQWLSSEKEKEEIAFPGKKRVPQGERTPNRSFQQKRGGSLHQSSWEKERRSGGLKITHRTLCNQRDRAHATSASMASTAGRVQKPCWRLGEKKGKPSIPSRGRGGETQRKGI